MQGGAVGPCTGDALVAQGHEHGQGNGLEAGEEDHPPTQHGYPIAEQTKWQQRFRAAAFVGNEQAQAKHGAGEQCQHGRVAPAMALADQGNAQQQAAQAENQQYSAKVVALRLAALYRHARQGSLNRPQGQQPQRQVDPEHAAP